MKFIYLVHSQLKNIIKNNKFMFIMFFIGIFICNIMFTYAYGNLKTAIKTSGHTVCEINNTNNISIDYKNIENELSDFTYIEYNTILTLDSLKENSNENLLINEFLEKNNTDKKSISLKTQMQNMDNIRLETGNKKKLEEENAIAVPLEILKDKTDFTNININGTNYNIVGSTLYDFLVSYDTYKNNNFKPDSISILLNKNMSQDEIDTYINKVENVFENFDITKPDEKDYGDFYKILILVSVVYLLCIFSMIFLITYLFQQSAYEMNVYEIIGATRAKIIFLLCFSQFIIILFISIISQLLHRLFYDSIFLKINFVDDIVYTASDYLSVVIITVALTSLFILFYILSKVKKSVIVNSRKFVS